MKIDCSFSAAQLDEMQLRGKNIVMIDVLRTSTTITVALANGAREIIPVATIENAVKISGSLFGDVTLRGGERNGKMIPGFNLGNSPQEYTELTVRGKSVIFCTTNGSLALVKARHARNLIVGGFVNITRVVEFIKEVNADFLLLCAGRAPAVGGFSLEDAVCAGMMVNLLSQDKSAGPELTDASLSAQALYKSLGRSPAKVLRSSDHGKYLAEIGFGSDLKLCAAVDSVPVVPIWIGTGIKLRRDGTGEGEPSPVQKTA